jgi:uncharacterized alpha-E superfamily protein
MSRYLERADHVARQMDVHLAIVPEQDNDTAQRRRSRLISCLVNHERPLAPVETDYDLMHLLIFDEDNHNSVVQCIAAARENARQVREQINSQMWEQINQLYLSLQNADLNQTWEGQPHTFLHNINQEVYRFQASPTPASAGIRVGTLSSWGATSSGRQRRPTRSTWI